MSMNLPRCQDQDGTGVLLETGTDSCHSARLSGRAWDGSQLPQLVKSVDIWDSDLCEQASLVHHGDSLYGVVTLCCLSRQHDTVSTVKNGVGDIGDLGSGGSGVELETGKL